MNIRAMIKGGGRLAGAFCRDRKAATADEFALVAAPFIFILMAVFELALVYTVSTTLDNATAKVARMVRTGQLQTAGGASTATFTQKICANMGWLTTDCPNNLSVDVRTYTNFQNIAVTSPVANGQFQSSALQFNLGTAGDIVLVRAYYQWGLFTPFLNGGLQPLSNGSALIVSTIAFRNEPYVAS